MDNLPIQYTTLDRRSSSFTTAALPIADADTNAALIIDRTVPNGLNFQSSDVEIDWTVEISTDNGLTWQEVGGGGTTGGISFDHHTNEWFLVTAGTFNLPAGTDRLLHGVVTTPSGLPPAFPVAFTGMLLADSAPISIAP